jgi:hypothetical protein
MKKTSRIIFILAIALIGYGYWGAFTKTGNKLYDEMDGFIPYFILLGGLVLLLWFIILVILMRKRAKKLSRF